MTQKQKIKTATQALEKPPHKVAGMETVNRCPECGQVWQVEGLTCQDDFHQLLFWENEFPEFGEVHHYMVLCYYMQHPRLYSPQTLASSKKMLADFLQGTSPSEMRHSLRDEVSSSKRTWKITGTPDAFGQYQNPVTWTMRVHDVVAHGPEGYIERVQAWAQHLYEDLKASGNL